MSFPSDLLYTKDHEWARVSGDTVSIGITSHAQDALGEVVFVELPKVGRELKTHDSFGVVESIKAVSDLYSPVAGTVTAINDKAISDPTLINREPYGDGWLIQVKLQAGTKLDELLKASDYQALVTSMK